MFIRQYYAIGFKLNIELKIQVDVIILDYNIHQISGRIKPYLLVNLYSNGFLAMKGFFPLDLFHWNINYAKPVWILF